MAVASPTVLAFANFAVARHPQDHARWFLRESCNEAGSGSLCGTAHMIASPHQQGTFTVELSPGGSPRPDVDYDYTGKQPIPAAGLTPARHTTLWAANEKHESWNRHAGTSSRRPSTSGNGVVLISSERVCPTTIRTGRGPTSSSRPADGAIYEVDLLVLTKQGFWLVECKAWSGRIWGDTGTWTRSQDGKLHSEDNPVLLANRKAKALSSLLKAQSAVSKIRLPWLDALVFLSADDLQCDLTGTARNRVLLKDRPETDTRPEHKGILAALINRDGPGIDPDLRAPSTSRWRRPSPGRWSKPAFALRSARGESATTSSAT